LLLTFHGGIDVGRFGQSRRSRRNARSATLVCSGRDRYRAVDGDPRRLDRQHCAPHASLPKALGGLAIAQKNYQWAITAYTLTFGGFLLLGGRIGDYMGRKKSFLIGLLGFAGASLLGGFAQNQQWLFGARALQGSSGLARAGGAVAHFSDVHRLQRTGQGLRRLRRTRRVGGAIGLIAGVC